MAKSNRLRAAAKCVLFTAVLLWTGCGDDGHTRVESAADLDLRIERLDRDLFPRITFYVYFLCDSDALPVTAEIQAHGGIYIPHMDFSKTSYRFVNRHAQAVAKSVSAAREPGGPDAPAISSPAA